MKKHSTNIISKGFLIALTGAILHSGKAIFTKLVYAIEPINGSSLLTLRMLFSLPFYALILFLFRKAKTPSYNAKAIKLSVFLGLAFYASALFDFEGLQYVSASIERLILFIYPSLVLVFLWIFFKKKIKKYQAFALFLTYTGILIAFVHEAKSMQFDSNFLKGSILVFICSCIYAWYIIKNSDLIAIVGIEKATSITMIICAIAATGVFLLSQPLTSLFNLPAKVYWLTFAMAVISTVLPTYMVAYGIKKIGSSDAAVVNSIGPVSTIVQAYFILGENIGMYQIAGTLLVITGVWMIGRNNKQS